MPATPVLNALPDNLRTFKALIAAQFSGQKVDISEVKMGTSNRTDQFLQKFPLGKVPTLELPGGGEGLFESNAIAFYLSNEQLRGGRDELVRAQVVQWMSFADNELMPAIASWVFPALGIVQVDSRQVTENGKNDLKTLLGILNQHLLSRTWLAGERLTLADIVVGCTLLPAFQTVLDPSIRSGLVNVTRWFNTFVNQPQVKAVLGEVRLNEKEGVTTAVKKGFPAASGAGAAGGQSSSSKSSSKSKSKKKQDDGDQEDEEEDDELKEKPSKDPFESFPKGSFNMDDFKRFYSNNPEEKAVDYFWEKFDPENYSIWIGEYKFPEELSLVFMSCNLMSGMMQRLDRMRKNAFGSLVLFGEDHKSTISQLWIWRGQGLAFELSDDWKVDYESYNWKKLEDTKSVETRTLVKQYFTWDFPAEMRFNQGKIFK